MIGTSMERKMGHLTIWDKHADIDPKFTKPITGKDYSGTSPNAQHIIWCLTEAFGPIGQGFGWKILAEGVEKFGDTSVHWCRIEFWHTERGNTFESYGQTKMAYMTKQGYLKVDEDAPKKSLTDAITKSAAFIGIAANIFLGRWDDNKHMQAVKDKFDRPPTLNEGELAVIEDLAKRAGTDMQALFNHLGVSGTQWGDLPSDLFETVRNGMQGKLDKMEQDHDQSTQEERE